MALSNVMETKDGVYEVMKVFLKIDHEVVILEEDVLKILLLFQKHHPLFS